MTSNYCHRIKEIRGSKSQKEFSDVLNVPLRTYIRYETGERDTPSDVLIKIALISGRSLDWILTGKEHLSADLDTIGKRLKFCREKILGIDEKHMSLRMGLKTPGEVIAFENDKVMPDDATLKHFSKVHKISLDWLKGKYPPGVVPISEKDRERIYYLFPAWTQRLLHRMNARNQNVDMISQATGIHLPRIESLIKHEQLPTLHEIEKLAEAVGISGGWLADGNFTMYGSREDLPTLSEFEDFIFVPRAIGDVSTPGSKADNTIEVRIAFRRDWISQRGDPSRMSLMRVKGDSMEPTLLSGDIVLVDHSRNDIEPQGGIYAIATSESIVIKRIQALLPKGTLKIICDNNRYEAYETTPDQVNIKGKVIWFGRDLER